MAPRPPLKALAWSARPASIFSLTILCASVAAALPPIANFMVRSPITEEASIPNEQASAQIASHELCARDRLRIITSYKEQDIILAGEGGARMLTGFAPICPALEQVSTGALNLSFFVAVITPCPRAFGRGTDFLNLIARPAYCFSNVA